MTPAEIGCFFWTMNKGPLPRRIFWTFGSCARWFCRSRNCCLKTSSLASLEKIACGSIRLLWSLIIPTSAPTRRPRKQCQLIHDFRSGPILATAPVSLLVPVRPSSAFSRHVPKDSSHPFPGFPVLDFCRINASSAPLRGNPEFPCQRRIAHWTQSEPARISNDPSFPWF